MVKSKIKDTLAFIVVLLWSLPFTLVLALLIQVSIAPWNSSKPFGSDATTLATVLIGVLAAAITLFWNYLNSYREELSARGALSINVKPENIASILNVGNTLVHILDCYACIAEYPRSYALLDKLNDIYLELKKDALKKPRKLGVDLSQKEEMLLPTLRAPHNDEIEKSQLTVEVLGIRYRTLGKIYIKFVGVYRLTGLNEAFLYITSQENNVNLQGVAEVLSKKGKFYPTGLLIDTIFEESKKNPPDFRIFPGSNSAQLTDIVRVAYCDFINHRKVNIDNLPENSYYIFRIEDILGK